MSKDPTIKARVARYTASQRNKGLATVRVWVPVDRAGELKEFARKLREQAQEEG